MKKEARLGVFRDIVNSQDIDELREGFIDTLTHDLKTPVLAQIRVLELLLDGNFGDFNNEQNDILKMTLDSCKYMYEMVMTLISTYRFDNENCSLNFSKFDIIELCENIIKSTKPLLNEHNIQITLIPKLKNPYILADFVRLGKTIKALLLNSINCAFKNTNIILLLEYKHQKLRVLIKYESGKISDEKITEMFSIFTSQDGNYDKIGTGIGLYMVKKIVEMHRGKIIIKSNLPNKTTLGFEIPQPKEELFGVSYAKPIFV